MHVLGGVGNVLKSTERMVATVTPDGTQFAVPPSAIEPTHGDQHALTMLHGGLPQSAPLHVSPKTNASHRMHKVVRLLPLRGQSSVVAPRPRGSTVRMLFVLSLD